MKSVNTVPITMPVTSTMPMLLRAPAPGPVARTSGKWPTTVAAVVMRIGRRRVLAAQFESFRDPFIVLAGSVPLAVSGALLFSFLGLTTLNIYSQVGLITLVGLVSKNGILIVQFANHLQETGLDKLHAVVEAAGTRLRPILMTTAATVVGHMPLVFATGPGAGARNSIGIMLVSGMIIGTIFTLFVVPSIYVLVARKHVAIPTETEQAREEPRMPELVGV